MPIPPGIKPKHIEAAAKWIDLNGLGDFRDGSKYEARVGTKWYPPKALIGHAARLGLGETLGPRDFYGGVGAGCALPCLEGLGFNWRAKPGRR
jgi:hypothetical protein